MSRMQEEMKKHNQKTPSQSPQSYVGIDVGKDTLDIYIHPDGINLRVMNDKKSITTLIKKLNVYDIDLIALEATSKYHRLAHTMFHEAGFAVSVINPFRSRQFADSIGKLAKTDKIDAQSLALYAQRLTPDVTLPPDIECKELRDLQTARRQVLDEIGDLKRQLHTTDHPLAKRQIKARIAMGERHKQALEEEIIKLIKAHEQLKHKLDIPTSIPCIGQTTASIILSELWELGQVNAKQISALAGHPYYKGGRLAGAMCSFTKFWFANMSNLE